MRTKASSQLHRVVFPGSENSLTLYSVLPSKSYSGSTWWPAFGLNWVLWVAMILRGVKLIRSILHPGCLSKALISMERKTSEQYTSRSLRLTMTGIWSLFTSMRFTGCWQLWLQLVMATHPTQPRLKCFTRVFWKLWRPCCRPCLFQSCRQLWL